MKRKFKREEPDEAGAQRVMYDYEKLKPLQVRPVFVGEIPVMQALGEKFMSDEET